MIVLDYKEIYDYNHLVRQNYIDFFQKNLEWYELTTNYNTAWLSLKDTLLHIIWAEDSWINYSINDLIQTGHLIFQNMILGKR